MAVLNNPLSSSPSPLPQDNIENVMYVWALCRDQSIYDHKTAWRVMEFAIQHTGKLLV